jgi:hypothetical protein
MKTFLALVATGLLVAASAKSVTAAPIINSATGVSNPGQVITFSEVVLPDGSPLTNQYSGLGVTFQGMFYNPQPLFFPTDPSAGNFSFTVPNAPITPFSIFFNTPQQAAAFQIVTNPGITTIEALLNGNVVESFQVATNFPTDGLYQGFEGITFDQIRVNTPPNTNLAALIDNLQSTNAPEPATLAVFGLLAVGAFGLNRRLKTIG